MGSTQLRCCSVPVGSDVESSCSIPSETVTVENKKIQIAVVGSGPSGCYVADYLTKKNPNIHVDIYEKLPVPFGLLRYGVAPDHPEVKNLEQKFKDMFKTSRVTWIGNIEVGRSIPVDLMLTAYTAVVFSTGANQDKELLIPGEHLGNVFGAREFVNFYNTYPSPHGNPHRCPFQLQGGLSGPITDAVVIGNGNVALDVVRVLASSYKYWCTTDMNCAAIKQLIDNKIRNVHVVGRRGVEHSAFTIAEFRELTKFESSNKISVKVDEFDLAKILELPQNQNRAKKRLFELVHKFTSQENFNTDAGSLPSGQQQGKVAKVDRGPCNVHFRYNLKPVEFLPHPRQREMVGGVRFEVTKAITPEMQAEVGDQNGNAPFYVVQPCELVLKSVGYASQAIRGVPFNNEKFVMENHQGRIAGKLRLYCSGWCKRGATGVIVHTMADAHATAQSILDDLENKVVKQQADQLGKYSLLDYFIEKNLYPISNTALGRIWKVEEERGIDLGKRYEKIPAVDDMLEIAMGGKLGKLAENRVRRTANARPEALLYLDQLLDETTDMRSFSKEIWKDIPKLLNKDATSRGIDMNKLL